MRGSHLRCVGLSITYQWRGSFTNDEVNALHAEAFETRVFDASEWDWVALTARHSLGWVAAREHGALVGFVNVPWDGFVHAWLQDTMVARDRAPPVDRHQIGSSCPRRCPVGRM